MSDRESFLEEENRKLIEIITKFVSDWNSRGEDTTGIDQYSSFVEMEEIIKNHAKKFQEHKELK